MLPVLVVVLFLGGAYLVGAIPFGYFVGRWKGVDLFQVGSGNIGATNVGRVVGRGYGILVFVLDFLKGALPVAAVQPVVSSLGADLVSIVPTHDVLRVCAAGFALLGHVFPVYLGFRGGKGVATGSGIVFVLVPGPALLGLLTWITVVLAFRYVSLASLAAAVVLILAQLLLTPSPLGPDHRIVTAFCLIGSVLVIVNHLANIRRLIAGTENQLGDRPMRQLLLRTMHVLAVGTWFGAAGFFTFITAPLIFASFDRVVNDGPSDRTAHQTIISSSASPEEKKALASALAGSAVGPIFPRYFLLQVVCGGVALLTAMAWWSAEGGRLVHRARVLILAIAVLLVAIGWPISEFVSQVRLERFHPDPDLATSARASFAVWHLISLAMSAGVTILAGIGLALAGRLPDCPKADAGSR